MSRRRRPTLRLLSVDWDYFFARPIGLEPDNELYDWGHSDSPFFRDLVWDGRAAAFLANGRDLPTTTGAEAGFWSRFRFAPGCRLAVTDSHACLALPQLQEGVAHVLSYDAHHDAGYKPDALGAARQGRWYCDTWAMLYQLEGAFVDVRYPPWMARAGKAPGWYERDPVIDDRLDRRIDDGAPIATPFDRAFLCRSAAWMPPWLDAGFDALVAAFPGPVDRLDRSPTAPRAFDLDAIRQQAEHLRQLHDPTSEYARLNHAFRTGGKDALLAMARQIDQESSR